MNHYEALERKGDGQWDYTRNNVPTGYCRAYKALDSKLDHATNEQIEEHHATAHKHHTGGHETKDEACECYREYLLDHHLRFSKMSNQQNKCRVCNEWGQNIASVHCRTFTLCDKHCDRESVEKIHGPVGISSASW